MRICASLVYFFMCGCANSYFLNQSWIYVGNATYTRKVPNNSNEVQKQAPYSATSSGPSKKCSRRGRSGLCQRACNPEGKGYGGCEDGSTCCIYIIGCNGETSQDVSYFQSPSFPEFDSEPEICNAKIKIKPGVCAVRFDFDQLSLAPPSRRSNQCKTDSLNIISNNFNPLCGNLDGYAVNIEVAPQQQVQKLTVLTKSLKYKWNIKMTQIRCSDVAPLPAYEKCGIRRTTPLIVPIASANKDAIIVENFQLPRSPLKEAFVTIKDLGWNQFSSHLERDLVTEDDPMESLERIYYGSEAKVGEFPWQVLLQRNNSVMCGGTLISDRHVVTAAHCMNPSSARSMVPALYVRLGEHDYKKPDNPFRQVIKVSKVTLHHTFDHQELSGDIAILELAAPAGLGGSVYPACMPSKDDKYVDNDGVISGFGKKEGGRRTSVLHSADVVVWSNQRCAKAWKADQSNLQLLDSQVCALGLRNQDSCQGDSGGPLVVRSSSGKHELVGITSFGDSCGKPNVPGIYTRFTSFLDWMRLAISDV